MCCWSSWEHGAVNGVGRDTASLLSALEIDPPYAGPFEENDDRIFGEKFYVYTTFSESQSDVNPTSEAGFRMIVDDLFHLLAGGDLAMMRMDAIKYLWKEIGRANFDMEEGNRLIEVIRRLLRLAAPRVLPLDERRKCSVSILQPAGCLTYQYRYACG